MQAGRAGRAAGRVRFTRSRAVTRTDCPEAMKFVIVAGSFDDRSGGTVALHLLCQRLAEAGETALLWPLDRLRLQWWRNPRRYAGWARYHLSGRSRRYGRGPFATRLAQGRDLRGAVVVYPETIDGNPLAASRVVRWLLHKPGFHTGRVGFGRHDLLFHYQDPFHDPGLGGDADDRLTLTWWNAAYRQVNFGERTGSAYLIKKGHGRPILHDLADSVLVDPLDHRGKAQAFNRARYFYTYDPFTLYSRYAALCGCIPIIVPVPGMTREQWVPREEERYGLAYGEEDIGWAVATRPLLLRQIADEQAAEAVMLETFIRKCRAAFAGAER